MKRDFKVEKDLKYIVFFLFCFCEILEM